MSSDFKDSKKGIGLRYALNGIFLTFRTERNFRIHVAFKILVIIVGFFLELSKLEWGIIILCIALVLMAEMLNSALELLIDHLFPNVHPVAGKVKDIAAGSVLIAAICSAIIGFIIFVPKIIIVLKTHF
ncbi:diacylglycerol kinase family protein [Salirhabdus sp. Marseille-P4669]|uniref:diacylglycerol kinase family protein n=1 Tax=Salirhabdus sp. Marseille-P4669 TaxID=2042310 RepID=UPI000C7C31B1|nr:diacylglycerol kinase family protein [Salirhabdus sp. Marseille-P4669]